MTLHRNARLRHEALRAFAQHMHIARPPARYEDIAAGADHYGVGIAPRRDPLHDVARGEINDGDGVGQILGHVEAFSVSTHGQSGGVAGAGHARIALHADRERVPGREPLAVPVIAIHRVRVASRREDGASVGRKHEADERGRLFSRLDDCPRASINHLHPLLPPSVQEEQQVRGVGGNDDREWEAPDIDLRAGGVEYGAGGKPARLIDGGARPVGFRGRAGTANQCGADQQGVAKRDV